MSSVSLAQLEEEIFRLPNEEQRLLIERLIPRLRERTAQSEGAELALSAMAEDPEIQREIQTIRREFAVTEADGLGRLG
jgi:hypothetical protein